MRKRQTAVFRYFRFEDDFLTSDNEASPMPAGWDWRELRAGIPKVGPRGFPGSS